MIVTTEWIYKNYTKYNRLYWGNKLPISIEFKVNNGKRNIGTTGCVIDSVNQKMIVRNVVISKYYDMSEKVAINTLLHEMVHVADAFLHPEHFFKNGHYDKNYDWHGDVFFKKEAVRLSKYGWVIETRTTEEEEKEMRLSDSEINKLNKKLEKGIIAYILTLQENKNIPAIYIPKDKEDEKLAVYNLAYNYRPLLIAKYITHSDNILKYRMKKDRVYTLNMTLDEFFDNNKFEYIETMYEKPKINESYDKMINRIVHESINEIINNSNKEYDVTEDPLVDITPMGKGKYYISVG